MNSKLWKEDRSGSVTFRNIFYTYVLAACSFLASKMQTPLSYFNSNFFFNHFRCRTPSLPDSPWRRQLGEWAQNCRRRIGQDLLLSKTFFTLTYLLHVHFQLPRCKLHWVISISIFFSHFRGRTPSLPDSPLRRQLGEWAQNCGTKIGQDLLLSETFFTLMYLLHVHFQLLKCKPHWVISISIFF